MCEPTCSLVIVFVDKEEIAIDLSSHKKLLPYENDLIQTLVRETLEDFHVVDLSTVVVACKTRSVQSAARGWSRGWSSRHGGRGHTQLDMNRIHRGMEEHALKPMLGYVHLSNEQDMISLEVDASCRAKMHCGHVIGQCAHARARMCSIECYMSYTPRTISHLASICNVQCH